MNHPKVVVVGSCMIDLTSYTNVLPRPGETVCGNDFSQSFGGKGANQCIAAARLGAQTAMIARVGKDAFGSEYLDNFEKNDVQREFVLETPGVSTGIASIVVDQTGENLIVITPGANNCMSEADVLLSTTQIERATVLVCQREINDSATKKALLVAKQHGVTSVLNVAPACKDLDKELYTLPDIFCVNEIEASILTGKQVENLKEAELACKILREKGCRDIIITLGQMGAVYYAINDTFHHAPTLKVETVVDTTGAGDSFVGCMAFLLAYRPDLKRHQMVEIACQVAATSVSTKGTQQSFMTKEQLEGLIEDF